ncbi:MAG: oligosaccharide flippase family protein [Prevotella sp.]|nr:oligosaccharide flippase family protein [Prevotella sp.]
MSSFSNDNKRIAKNTAYIYLRVLVTTLVGLLTARYVLKLLGVSDFGLYNVVGGILGLLGIVSGALSMTTTRFINYEMGKKDGNVNRIFNICQYMHVGLALILLLLAETVGVYYVLYVLNVSPDKRADAMFVFQVSTVVSCLGILNVPYSSLLLAFEKFGIEAAMSIFNTFFKLFIVIILFYIPGNTLRYYALGMSLITLITFIVYHYIDYKKWPQVVRPIKIPPMREFREMFVYNNYNILSSLSIICRSQGSTLLINYFFGTIVNGAFAVAYSIQQYVLTLTDNIDRAAAPQIVQNVSKGDSNRSGSLVNSIGKISILIMALAYFPLAVEIETILKLWLGNVPEGAATFCQYTLLVAFVAATSGGMGQVINASGKIKWFKIQMATLYVLVIPVAFVLYKMGCPPYTILLLFVISDLLSRINQLILMKHILKYDVRDFIKHAYLPPLKVFGIMLVYCFIYRMLPIDGFFVHLAGFVFTLVVTALVEYYVALTKEEKSKVTDLIVSRFRGSSI